MLFLSATWAGGGEHALKGWVAGTPALPEDRAAECIGGLWGG